MEQQVIKQLFEGIEKLGTKFDIFAASTSDRLTKIETMFSMFDKAQNNLSDKVGDVDKVASEALSSTKAAHKRMDNIKDDMGDLPSKAEFEALKAKVDNHGKIFFWVSTLVIGAVIMAVMGTIMINK